MPDTYKRPEGFEKEALDNWNAGIEANQKQNLREEEDLSWQVAENQWDDASRTARGYSSVGGVGSPARPMLSIPKIRQSMSLVDSQFRSAHLGVNIHPLSDDADDDTAEVWQDLYRMMERESNAGQARWWAFDRAKQAGRGWYRLNTVYDEQSADPFDQKVVIERILYQNAVVMDPSAVKADCSDAQWGFLSAWMPLGVFKRRWPEANLAKIQDAGSARGFDLEEACASTPNWVKNDGDRKAVQVAEYWCKHYIPRTIKSADGQKERVVQDLKLMWYVLAPGGEDGFEVVEEQEWNGDEIPLIPAIGSELQPFDDERRYEGMVRPARDGQKLFNFTASTAAEKMASLPKSPWLVDIAQIEGFEDVWAQSNTRTFPYLPFRSVSLDGRPIADRPDRTPDDGAGLQPILAILQQADEFIQSATSTPDPVLGKRNSRNESGKAIQALQGQSEASNSSYIQNFSDITMMYEAKCAIGMMKRVYDRPGRVVRALNIQGETRPVILNQDFTLQNGRPVPVKTPPQVPGQSTTMPVKTPENVKRYDLSKGYYGISVTVGKSFNTKREQAVDLLLGVTQMAPELGMALSPILLRHMDGPGMKEAADVAQEFVNQKIGILKKGEEGQETPEQLKAMLGQAQAQMQQMQQAGQQLQEEIKTDQAKQQAAMAKAQLDAQIESQRLQMEFEKARMDNETKIRVAEIAAGAKVDTEQLAAVISLVLDKSKAAQEQFNRRHEADLHHTELAHDVAMAMTGQDHERDMADKSHEQGLESQQAAMEAESAREDAQEGSEE